MNYLGRRYLDPKAKRTTSASFKKVIVSMRDDFNFPAPPSVERDGAIQMPPRISKRVHTRFWRHLLPTPTEQQKQETMEKKA
jgi:hypothetical protein